MKAKMKIMESEDMFGVKLENILNLKHELCQLKGKIHWEILDEKLAGYFPSEKGNPALPTELVVGMFYLKYTYGLSDEQTVARWIENPYWQYFCGMEYFQHEVPFHPTSFVKWRKRLEEKGCEELLKEVIQAGIKTNVICAKDIQKVTVDTTVQEKFITHPTDAKLKHRARILLLKEAKKQGLKLRQTYVRLGSGTTK